MYHYRQALVRMRQGESDRQIQATGLMGRRTLGALRKQAQERGWLDPARSVPPDHELAAVLQRPSRRIPTHNRASNLTGVWSNSGAQRASTAPPSTLPSSAATGTPAATHRCVGFCSLWQRKRPGSRQCLSSHLAMQRKSISAKALRSLMSIPAKCSKPGCSLWCSRGADISTPNWCVIKASRPGSVVTAARSNTSTVCHRK